MKSSTYYFHMKTKILADFQICIIAPLNMSLVSYRACWSGKLYFKRSLSPAFCWCHHKFENASRRQFYGIKFILEKVSLMIWILLLLTSDCHFFLTKIFADISKNNEKCRKSHEIYTKNLILENILYAGAAVNWS